MGYEVGYFDPGTPAHHYHGQYPEHYEKITCLSNVLEWDGERTCYIVAVGDRVSEEGVQDISLIRAALDSLKGAKGMIVLRSTILPETLDSLRFDFYVPEFLHEKNAVEECLFPHFFVVGTDRKRKEPSFLEAWRSRTPRYFNGTPREAALIKYLSNLWNALRIGFVNEFGDLVATPETKEDLDSIERVVNFVMRGEPYLRYGRAFGGHCLPKDTRAFTKEYRDKGKNVAILEGAWKSNDAHAEMEKAHPIVPEWYSAWALPHLSGFVALRELWYSIRKNLFHPREIIQRRVLGKDI
jgi:UDP-glucose 6-dehydrogenase